MSELNEIREVSFSKLSDYLEFRRENIWNKNFRLYEEKVENEEYKILYIEE